MMDHRHHCHHHHCLHHHRHHRHHQGSFVTLIVAAPSFIASLLKNRPFFLRNVKLRKEQEDN
jgi:hypothetical protein